MIKTLVKTLEIFSADGITFLLVMPYDDSNDCILESQHHFYRCRRQGVIQSHPYLFNKSEVNLGHMRFCLRKHLYVYLIVLNKFVFCKRPIFIILKCCVCVSIYMGMQVSGGLRRLPWSWHLLQ